MRRELIMRQEHLTSFLLRLQGRKLVKRVTRYNLRYLVQPLTERSQTLPRTSKISPPTSGHSEIVSADGQIDSRRAPGGALSMPRTSTQPTPTLGHRWCPSPARSTAPGGGGGHKDEGAGKKIWRKKFCGECQVSVRPPCVYASHDTAGCRYLHQIEAVASLAATIMRGPRTMRRPCSWLRGKVQYASRTELCNRVSQFAPGGVYRPPRGGSATPKRLTNCQPIRLMDSGHRLSRPSGLP